LADEADLVLVAVGHVGFVTDLHDRRAGRHGRAQATEQLRVLGLPVALPVVAELLGRERRTVAVRDQAQRDVVPAAVEGPDERSQRGARRLLAPELDRRAADAPAAAVVDERQLPPEIDVALHAQGGTPRALAQASAERLGVRAPRLELGPEGV